MDYAMTFKDHGTFTPNGKVDMTAEQAAQHNADLASAELDAWSKQPDQWAVYVEEGEREVTTWTGAVLGTIIERTRFRTNISRNMVSIRFKATNGATYYGRYGADRSMLCRVRKAK